MTPIEAETVKSELIALTVRAEQAERCAARNEMRALKAESERDLLRSLLSRSRTSLTENFNDPGVAR